MMWSLLRNKKFANLVFSGKVFNQSILDSGWSNGELKNPMPNGNVYSGGTSPVSF